MAKQQTKCSICGEGMFEYSTFEIKPSSNKMEEVNLCDVCARTVLQQMVSWYPGAAADAVQTVRQMVKGKKK